MKEFIKPMVYSAERKQPEQIAAGTYKGLDYYVINLGTHPCGYVNVAGTALYGKDCYDINIECHGGLSYSESHLKTVTDAGWFVGWDYAHYDDFIGWQPPSAIGGKHWTTEEIVNECKNVINQIKKIIGRKKEV